jgi:uncharacterized protein YjbI with pentapeptide repeats
MVSTSLPAAAARAPKPKKPGAPTSFQVIPVSTALVVSWAPPATDGGSPIIGYEVSVTRSTETCTTTSTSCIVKGLQNGRKYNVKVQAQNAVGYGKAVKTSAKPTDAQNCSYVGTYGNLQSCDLMGENLGGYNLSFADMAGADLGGTTLTGANLEGTYLTGANLNSADLEGAYLVGTRFDNCECSGADLQSATATNATFGSANLSEANFQSADLLEAVFTNADLTDAVLTDTDMSDATMYTTELTGVRSGGITGIPVFSTVWGIANGYLVGPGANLTDADFGTASLAGDILTGADLSGANLSQAVLTGVVIDGLNGVITGNIVGVPSSLPPEWELLGGYLVGPGANLYDADLSNLDFGGVDLTGADLNGADIQGTEMSTSSLDGVYSGQVTGTPASLPSEWNLVAGYLVGPGANLESENLDQIDFSDLDLAGVDLSGANIVQTAFDGTNLAGADLEGTSSYGITGTPSALPTGYSLIGGYFVGPGVALWGEVLSGLNLTNVDFTGATLTNVDFTDADLDGVNLTNADLLGAELTGASLSGVVWSNTTCPDGTDSGSDGGTCINNE